MKLASYLTDKTAEVEGKAIQWGEGATLWIARANNPQAQDMRKKLTAAYNRPGFRTRKISDKDELRITIQILAHACIKRWEGFDLTGLEGMLEEKYGIKVENPKETPYTPELGVAILTEMEDFCKDVLLVATNEETYRAEDVEADSGN